MAVGMSTVFAFLVLLVLAVQLTAALVARFAPDPPPKLAVDDAETIAVALATALRSRS